MRNHFAVLATLIFCCLVQSGCSQCPSRIGQLYILTDVSKAAEPQFQTVSKEVTEMIRQVGLVKPDAEFAFGTYSDRTYPETLGNPGDHCFQHHVPMTTVVPQVATTVRNTKIMDGGDAKNSQLAALYYALSSAEVGWKFDSSDGIRVVVMTAASPYHQAGEAEEARKKTGQNDEIHPFVGGNTAQPECHNSDYPSVTQVGELYRQHRVLPVFLVSNSLERVYYNLLREMKTGGVLRRLDADTLGNIETIISNYMGCKETDLPVPTEPSIPVPVVPTEPYVPGPTFVPYVPGLVPKPECVFTCNKGGIGISIELSGLSAEECTQCFKAG